MAELPKGGSYLLGPTDPNDIFSPEDFAEEHKMIFRTALGFVKDRILTTIEDMEAKKEGLNKQLLLEAGGLGLLGIDIPEEYGGFEMDKISTSVVAECMGWSGGFAMTHGAQTGIGSLPIVFFGTQEQKMKYLPGIAAGETVSAYALTEPGAGSDALAAKTWAVLSPDGKHYILNGTKQFITNAPIADLFMVFAKIDREKFTCFIVERDSEGLSTGPEEHKMGIKSSNTSSLILEDVKVPVENVLYEIGKGHVIAFNILNMGRYKTAANVVGNNKYALELSATYANDRRQFNKPIAEMGMIKEKLAEMNIRTYVVESMVYRTGGLLSNILHSLDLSGPNGGQVAAKGIEEYAMECSINKVLATEIQGFVMDEGVQIHGGYGFTSEYPIERLYRDCRIYRIFEGTNEVNRTVTINTLVRRGLKGDILLQPAIEKVKELVASGVLIRKDEEQMIQAAKDILLFTLGAGIEKYEAGILKHQEIIGRLADIAMYTFAMESAWLRAQKAIAADGEAGARLKRIMATVYIYSNIEMLVKSAKEVLSALTDGQELANDLDNLSKLHRYIPRNIIALRQEIASAVSEAGKYVV